MFASRYATNLSVKGKHDGQTQDRGFYSCAVELNSINTGV